MQRKILSAITVGVLTVGAFGCLAGCGTETSPEIFYPVQGTVMQVKDVKAVQSGNRRTNSFDAVIQSASGLQAFLEEYPDDAEAFGGYSVSADESLFVMYRLRPFSDEHGYAIQSLQQKDAELFVYVSYYGGTDTAMMPVLIIAKTERLNGISSVDATFQGLSFETDEYRENTVGTVRIYN